MSRAKPTYRRLLIQAASPTTDIWLGDDLGFLVQKETGKLDTSVLTGNYVVEFGLGSTTYPIHLTRDRHSEGDFGASVGQDESGHRLSPNDLVVRTGNRRLALS